MAKVELLIFDMDGLMFETEKIAYRAYLRAAEKYDFEMTHDLAYFLTGRSEPDIREEMAKVYGCDITEWRDAVKEFKLEIIKEDKRIYKKKGLLELLTFAKTKNMKLAVASSTDKERVNEFLKLEEVSDYFDVVVSGDEVEKSKPNPEIFLKACEKSGVSTENAIVLEDSRAGIEAANNAEITSVLVEDDLTSLPTWSGKHKILTDLSYYRNSPVPADYQFEDLLEVRDFLIEKNLLVD